MSTARSAARERMWLKSIFIGLFLLLGFAGQAKASNEVVVHASGVNVRSGPGTSHAIVGKAFDGDTFFVITSSNGWYKVQLPGGNQGWVSGWYIHFIEKSAQSKGSLHNRVIVIDPGHGGYDAGARGPTGLKEKDANLEISLLTANYLRAKGAKVVLTREVDKFTNLEQRTAIAAQNGAEIFVSIHNNANTNPGLNGISTYYRRDNITWLGVSQSDNRLLSTQIHSALVKSLNRRNAGVFQTNFLILRSATMPAVLVEVSFISNPEEEWLLKQYFYKDKAAKAIASGIEDYFKRRGTA